MVAEGPGTAPVFAPGSAHGCPARAHAVASTDFGSTRTGTLVHVGRRCGMGPPMVEIWPEGRTRSTVVTLELSDYTSLRLLRGQGDRMVVLDDRTPVGLVEAGSFRSLPEPPATPLDTFTSPAGDLFVVGAEAVFLLTDRGWRTWGTLDAPMFGFRFALRGTQLVATATQLFELVPGRRLAVAADEACATPFVHLETLPRWKSVGIARSLYELVHADPDLKRVVARRHGLAHHGVVASDMDAARRLVAGVEEGRVQPPPAYSRREPPRIWCWAPTDVEEPLR